MGQGIMKRVGSGAQEIQAPGLDLLTLALHLTDGQVMSRLSGPPLWNLHIG
jgi:hypothetical protein